MDLKGKVAFVTGGGSGIGKASAVRFAQAGARIAVMARHADDLKETVDEIVKAGGEAIATPGDVSKEDELKAAIDATVAKFGRLDVVMPNAGVNGKWAPIEELEVDDFRHTVDINLLGTFLTIKHAVPHLKKAGGGSIVVVASINGTRTFSNTGATLYASTKAAQLGMAKMLAVELARSKIRVNVICPGAIDTHISESTVSEDIKQIRVLPYNEGLIPLNDNKPGTSQQVAELALFLASDASSHITGTPIWIDGGQSLLI